MSGRPKATKGRLGNCHTYLLRLANLDSRWMSFLKLFCTFWRLDIVVAELKERIAYKNNGQFKKLKNEI